MASRICFFNRSSVHYREEIYKLMDTELNCDFYFGDSRPGGIKPIDESLLSHVKGHLKNKNLFGQFFWQKGALSLLFKDYDCYITPGETYCLSTWVIMFLAPLLRKKVYLWTHGAYGNETGFKLWLTKFRISLCSGAFLYGNYAKNNLIQYGCNEKKLHVIYNSLSYDLQCAIRGQLIPTSVYCEHFGNNNPNLVFIGRLTKVKKLNQILSAMKILSDKGFSCNLTLVGDGIEKDALVAQTSEYGLSNNVWFYGACYKEEIIASLLYNADICVSPGNVGLTAMHAMAYGCPVISHSNFSNQMPEFEAVESGKTGLFFKENDAQSLANTILEWFGHMIDRDIIRESCYSVIDNKYNPHKQIQVMNNIINCHGNN